MLNFESDYVLGAHPKILERLVETNMVFQSGYGHDEYTEAAKEKIKAACGRPDVQVHFLTGGTQTNQIIIATMLRIYEGVVSTDTGHVAVHESGAIEYTGHKVLTVPNHDGKMDPAELKAYLETFFGDANNEHMVFPGMVYLTHPTEFGTLYTKAELTAISETCRKYDLPLFLDGARFGYGLMSRSTDVTMQDVANLCDVFYIGGTKVGALCGEAVVFTHGNMPAHFEGLTKKHGALLAKGRLLGVQFDALFTDDLYFEISKNAIDRAEELKSMLAAKGYTFAWESPTNQQFVVVSDEKYEELKKHVKVSFWEKADATHTTIRICTSWATTKEDLAALEQVL